MAPYPNPYELPDRSRLTVDEYLAYDQGSEMRNEFWEGVLYHRPGGTFRHNNIMGGLLDVLHRQLRSLPNVDFFVIGIRTKVSNVGYAFPDMMIVAGKAEFEPYEDSDNLLNPTVLIEIIDERTADFDRHQKFEYYKMLPTLQEYLLIGVEAIEIQQFVRQPNNHWWETVYTGMEAEFSLLSVPCLMPLADIYEHGRFRQP